ncbi:1-phosphofructokinase [Heyndrickxia acidicola]|uniref:Tagatose-6-phosphate kinase n=1 Tax=Heyndrickxia acidicola TaxID=209389 RepID=A0ABU6MM72_9BACI|nr:1-phosphofructokinase [Heyndrickxia acidicola]MED1204317.1 1-phosphofructokinase [Heyndrickxia acidicola]
MIYTVTLNPSVDYVVEVEDFAVGKLNRSKSDLKLPGGKGINVSLVLKRLGTESRALGFIGGFTGFFIESFLKRENIQTDFVQVNEDTRINIKLKTGGETEINGSGPHISTEKYEEFLGKLDQLTNEDIIVFSGSIPKSLSPDVYSGLIHVCKEKGVKVVADVSGAALKSVIRAKPFLVKPNHHELGEIFKTSIETIEDAAFYGKKLVEMGVENVIISMAEKGALFINKKALYHANAPKGELKNSVGAGDSVVGGFLSAYATRKDYQEAFRMGTAAGSATAFSMELCKKEDVFTLLTQVEITHL